MLILQYNLFEAICREGESGYPQECCGLLAGNKTADDFVISAIFPMKNHVASEILDRYRIDPKERSIAEEEIASTGMALVGFYHSHPDHDAYFSKTDLENSEEYQFGEPWLTPAYAYFVLSVKKAKAGDSAAFIIQEGKVKEIPIQLQKENTICSLK